MYRVQTSSLTCLLLLKKRGANGASWQNEKVWRHCLWWSDYAIDIVPLEESPSMTMELAFQIGYCCWSPWPSCGSGSLGLSSAAVHGACDQTGQSLAHMAQVATICPRCAGMTSCFRWRIGSSDLHTRTLACQSCPIYPAKKRKKFSHIFWFRNRLLGASRIMWIETNQEHGF